MVSLALRDLEVSYGRRAVLRGISLPELRGGEITALLGPNAAGKSTLFRRIVGQLKGPGTVALDGRALDSLPPQHPDRPCYLPQDTSANAVLTVFEAVLLAGKQGGTWSVSDAEADAVTRTLMMLEIAELAARNLGELSGGQRQLVALAQAWCVSRRCCCWMSPPARWTWSGRWRCWTCYIASPASAGSALCWPSTT
jgi:iron complex transport system ATP-binding protein